LNASVIAERCTEEVPTYEYECLESGHRFEEFQSMTEPSLTTCPICGGQVRRLISGGAGILFKGSGFYQTDYRSQGYREAEKAEQSALSSSSSSGPAKESPGKDSSGTSTPKGTDPPRKEPAAPGKGSGSTSESVE